MRFFLQLRIPFIKNKKTCRIIRNLAQIDLFVNKEDNKLKPNPRQYWLTREITTKP